ncbi:hypothetical protein L226DRAFT_615738 [Lentinus tigrinus ALCF2SS1-7]|uniref:F-box domain-containing protein n=1 Tax=Lentinus tigrinus ALCF2SS1-6 TaxID=1328759 RepID=A0A5C2RYR2_9APHY|nr:hypothetical protein L227DRAFT_635564 [Lentinus tigrinus ALCF2SS1-6]RPD70993.1 hypothetical protein L226DRAFT_615738 [Lentinus tigrinus ALCF2SS1-7]
MNVDNEVLDLLHQVQLMLNARQRAMSISCLHESSRRVLELKATLDEQINFRAPVNRLPNELVIEIFRDVLHENEPCPTIALDVSDTARVQTRPLLWLTHVCRRWRRIALSHPLLWQRVDCHNQEQLHEFLLRRSDPGPFSLFINVSKYSHSAWPSALAAYPNRLRRLDVAYGRRKDGFLHTELMFNMRFPNLECLTITRSIPTAVNRENQPPVTVSHKSLFCGDVSHLRALAIILTPHWFPSKPLPSLTHLFLSFYWHSNLRMPLLLSFLAGVPALQVLQLSRFVLPPQDQEQERTLVSLNHLKYIVFSHNSYLPSSLAFLKQIVTPSSARMYLNCVNIDSLSPISILPSLSATAETDCLTVFTTTLTLNLVAQGHDSGFWLYGRKPLHSIDDFAMWLTHLPVMFPLSRLSCLQLHLYQQGPAVVRILRETASLTTLEIKVNQYMDSESDDSKDSLVHICRALSEEHCSLSAGVAPSPSICPSLHTMTLVLSNSRMTPQSSYARWLDAILSMILARARMRRPFSRLAVQPIEATPSVFADPRTAFANEVCVSYAAALADHVEDFVVYGAKEELFELVEPGADWEEVERYWTIPDIDQPRFSHGWEGYG